jgi:O-antigen ligase
VVSLGAFVVGMALALFDRGLRADASAMRGVRAAARAALILAVIVGLGAAAVAIGNPSTFARHKWDQFRDLNASTPTTTRYASVGGQRYDLWRVAVKEFASAPVGGVGVGNYSFSYYRERATNRNLNDPHSLVFGLLSETGAVGVALFAMFLVGIAATMRGGWRAVSPAARRHAIAAATVGVVLLGQSAVDWIWLIPGLTAIGLFALAVAAAQLTGTNELEGRKQPERASFTPLRVAARATIIGGLAVSVLAIVALFLSDAYVNRARNLTDRPHAELAAARTAARLDPWSVTPYYLEASALETLGDRPAAFQQLRDALSIEPENSASLGVLGDFEARAGDARAARAYYRRALALNPLDAGLQQLAHFGQRTASPETGAHPAPH